MAKKKDSINKDMNIWQVLLEYPGLEEVFADYGLHCAGCALSSLDTIEEGSKIHGLSDEDVSEMVERLNEVVSEGE
jgi:hybrid cluster-associated redox disulfide protein